MNPKDRKRIFWIFSGLLAVILVGMFSPILVVIASNMAAKLNGCTFIAGQINPCVIGSADLAKHMGTIQHAPWLLFYTVPVGLIALVLWLIGLILAIYFGKKARSETS